MHPTASETGTWVIIFFTVLTATGTIMNMINSIRSQRRQVSLTENFATVTQLDEVKTDLKEWKAEIRHNGEVRKASIENRVEKLRIEVKEDINEVRQRVADCSSEISGLSGKFELMNTQLLHISTQLQIRERK
jgi:hypothetical protein